MPFCLGPLCCTQPSTCLVCLYGSSTLTNRSCLLWEVCTCTALRRCRIRAPDLYQERPRPKYPVLPCRTPPRPCCFLRTTSAAAGEWLCCGGPSWCNALRHHECWSVLLWEMPPQHLYFGACVPTGTVSVQWTHTPFLTCHAQHVLHVLHMSHAQHRTVMHRLCKGQAAPCACGHDPRPRPGRVLLLCYPCFSGARIVFSLALSKG